MTFNNVVNAAKNGQSIMVSYKKATKPNVIA